MWWRKDGRGRKDEGRRGASRVTSTMHLCTCAPVRFWTMDQHTRFLLMLQ